MADSKPQPKAVISRSVIAKKEMKQLRDTSQNFIGVWLDSDADKETYVDFKQDLKNTFDCLEIYSEAFECIANLHTERDSKILFILSLKYASNVIPLMKPEDLPQIHSIYIYCLDELEENNWNSENVKKLRGVFVGKDELIQKLKDDIKNETLQTAIESSPVNDTANEYIKNTVPNTISVFSRKSINNSIKHLDKDSVWFIRYQLLLEILLKLEKSITEDQDMLDKCNEFCENDQGRLKQIAEFEKDVNNAFQSIYWYTKDSFIIHLLNRVCGSQNVNDIYSFRLFIRNLHEEIVKLDADRRKNPPKYKSVFRGKFISESTFKKLENNKNGLVVMNGFLSTSEDKLVALDFASGIPNSDQRAVLFELNIDSDGVNKPYAKIPPKRHAKQDQEKEVLFSIGSVWRIINVQELKNDTNLDIKFWHVQLKLSDEDDEESKKLAKTLKEEIGEKSSLWTLGDFLTKVGQYKEAEEYYRLLLKILPNTEVDLPNIYNRIAYVRYEKKDYPAAQDYLKFALAHASKDSEAAAVIEHNQQTIASELSHTSKCQTTLRRKLEDNEVSTKYLISNSALKAIIKNNYGRIYHQQGDFQNALKYFDDALTILRKSELSYLPEISAIYNNIGGVQYSKGDYEEAEKQFTMAMVTIAKFDSDHPWCREYSDNHKTAQSRRDSNKPKRAKIE